MANGKTTAENLEERFDAGEDVSDYFDMEHPIRINAAAKRISMDISPDMVLALDREADRLGVNRQAVIKIAIDRYLDERAECLLMRNKVFRSMR